MTVTEMTTPTSPFAGVLEAAASAPAPGVLHNLRDRGRKNFASLGLPSRRQEEWRFTLLKALQEGVFEPPARVAPRIDIAPWRVAGSQLLVFVDGVFDADSSDVTGLPDGVVVSNLVLASAVESKLVEDHLGSLAPLEHHPFAALNTALLADGALIYLPEDVVVTEPIQLLFANGAEGRSTLSTPRILIIAGAGSRATVVENHVGAGGASLSCPVSEIVLGENAVLEHVAVQEEGADASHLAVRQIQLAATSRYSGQSISLGGALARTDINVVLDGEAAVASLDGFYVTDGKQQADTHITVRHAQPNSNSFQLYKGILGGSSRAVFNGRIIVDQDAQKTDAKQSNRNLVLSDNAIVNSNPQLEIFADDVRCTHGSTIGRLDEEAIFYLRTRGIGREEARSLLTLAFAGEILDRIPVTQIRERLESEIASRLSQIEKREEHQ